MQIKVERLEEGDFQFWYYSARKKLWLSGAGWESKTWSDLANSISRKKTSAGFNEGRIKQQLTKLHAKFPVCGVIIKGELEAHTQDINPMERQVRLRNHSGWYDSGWKVKELRGFLMTLQDRGEKIVEVPFPDELPWVLRWLHDHYQRHRGEAGDHFFEGSAVPRAMLDCIPGVGPDIATRLHEEFDANPNSLAGVINSTEAELVTGYGPKIGKEIYRRFH